MSIRPLDEQKCPLDIQMSIRPLDEWTLSNGKHSSLLSTWGQITSLQLPCIVNVTCPLDINKCPFVQWTNRNVHWTFKCPFVYWTNRNVHWTFKYPFVHWTEMSIGHSNIHSSIGRTEVSIGHSNVHSSIGRMDKWTLSKSEHSSFQSTWGQTQSDYVITASLAL